jgi:hypothetical protein
MRAINIRDDIELVLRQLAIALPEVFLNYDVERVEIQVDDEDRPTVWDIVFVESDETEIVLGEIVLLEDFTASFEIFEADES